MRVGFIGLGEMGLPMARNLAAAGHRVSAFDRDSGRVAAAQGPSLNAAPSVRAAAEAAEIVHVTVFTDDQVRAIVTGPDGVLGAVAPGAVIVIHSTIPPSTCRDLAREAAVHGVHVVDAGMTGAAAMAEQGRLTLLVGGDDEAVETCRPEFAAVATSVLHLGHSGAGMTGKIVNNLLVLANAEVLREMVVLAAGAGIDEDTLLALVSASSGRSWASENWARLKHTVVGGGDPHYAAMSRKDSHLAEELARQQNLTIPIVDLVAARLTEISGSATDESRGSSRP